MNAPAVERRRLNAQAERIFNRLEQSPATNAELSRYALSYTRRISDLREAGHVINIIDRDYTTGLVWYALGDDPSPYQEQAW